MSNSIQFTQIVFWNYCIDLLEIRIFSLELKWISSNKTIERK